MLCSCGDLHFTTAVCCSTPLAVKAHGGADVFINFASFRRYCTKLPLNALFYAKPMRLPGMPWRLCYMQPKSIVCYTNVLSHGHVGMPSMLMDLDHVKISPLQPYRQPICMLDMEQSSDLLWLLQSS